MAQFISEDDPDTFEGWLKYQAISLAKLRPDELTMWRSYFEESKMRSPASAKVGLMKLKSSPGEFRYAVAVREGSDLWLILWVRKSKKGEFFLMVPRNNGRWNPHTSYHLDGTFHSKSFGKAMQRQKRQPLTVKFCGTEQFPGYGGFGPKSVGAICNPADFTGIVEVSPGVLGPRDGTIVVDLVEPGHEAGPFSSDPLILHEVFKETIPWINFRIFWSAP